MNQERRGIFVALEGIDGSGTTTQATRLRDRIRHLFPKTLVALTAEPSMGPVGMLIRNILRGRLTPFDRRALALLFAADRLDHVTHEIEPALERGGVVISDRYVLSSFAYQALDAPTEWVAEINRFALRPDITIFLDVAPEVALGRIANARAGRDLFETSEMLERIAAAYREALGREGIGPVEVLDGTRPRDEVEEGIFRVVAPLLTRLG